MKVKDLIEKLKELPQDLEIVEYFGELGTIQTKVFFEEISLFKYKRTGRFGEYVEKGKSIPDWKETDSHIDWDNPISAILMSWGPDYGTGG